MSEIGDNYETSANGGLKSGTLLFHVKFQANGEDGNNESNEPFLPLCLHETLKFSM